MNSSPEELYKHCENNDEYKSDYYWHPVMKKYYQVVNGTYDLYEEKYLNKCIGHVEPSIKEPCDSCNFMMCDSVSCYTHSVCHYCNDNVCLNCYYEYHSNVNCEICGKVQCQWAYNKGCCETESDNYNNDRYCYSCRDLLIKNLAGTQECDICEKINCGDCIYKCNNQPNVICVNCIIPLLRKNT